MTSKLKVSLLGLGRAGRFHLESIRQLDEVILASVYDLNHERMQQVAEQFGCRAAAGVDEAVGHSDVDAVMVATPTDTHYEYVVAALEAGKPVLTEKPLGRRLDQIDTCFGRAADAGQPLFVAFQRRFDPSFAALVEGVHAGRVGRLQFVRTVSRDNPVPSLDYIRTSGGIFHDCMVHDLDMICHIAGETPTQLAALASCFDPEVRALDDFDTVAATLAFADGVLATIDVSRKSVYGYDQRIEAFGDAGMLQAENRPANTVVHATEGTIAHAPIEYSFPTRYRDAYRAELECFAACARGEREVPISHDDVRTNFLLASGLEIAAREGRVVDFDEIESNLTAR